VNYGKTNLALGYSGKIGKLWHIGVKHLEQELIKKKK